MAVTAHPSSDPSRTVVFLFDTTHHCLWAEEVAHGAGLPAEVVPAPPDRGEARCDLALETFRAKAGELAAALSKEAVEFYWPAGVSRSSDAGNDRLRSSGPTSNPPVRSSKE